MDVAAFSQRFLAFEAHGLLGKGKKAKNRDFLSLKLERNTLLKKLSFYVFEGTSAPHHTAPRPGDRATAVQSLLQANDISLSENLAESY